MEMAFTRSHQSPTPISEWLKQLRLRAGFTQQNIANTINVSRSTYTYYENGKTTPEPTVLNRIATIYGVPIELFFSEERPEILLGDIEYKRSPKKVKIDPVKIGDLSSAEKDIIAYLRDKGISAVDILQALKNRFES